MENITGKFTLASFVDIFCIMVNREIFRLIFFNEILSRDIYH